MPLVEYPEKPDSKGSARLYVNRRAYYFGQYGSPKSHLLFGMWAEIYEETGEPPELRDVRVRLYNASNAGGHPLTAKHPAFIAAVALICLTIIASAKIVSAKLSPVVDGQELSENEQAFIRAGRYYRAKVANATFDQDEYVQVAKTLDRIRRDRLSFDAGKRELEKLLLTMRENKSSNGLFDIRKNKPGESIGK